MSSTPTPSPQGASYVKHDEARRDTMEIDVKADVDQRDWQKFTRLLNATDRRQFISDILADALRELLYTNPDLFDEYVPRDALRHI